MRLSRFLIPAAALLMASCAVDGGPVSNDRPPLGGVRYINGLADEGPVDIRMVDQSKWAPYALGINFRQGGVTMAAQAGTRHIRVWRAGSDIESIPMIHEENIDIVEGESVTLLLTGSVQAGTIRFVVIPDAVPDSTANQIHIRGVNATGTPMDLSWINGDEEGPSTSVASMGQSAYIAHGLSKVTAKFGAATQDAPAGAAQANGIGATAGYLASGSGLSAYVFPASVPGSAAPEEFTEPGIVWFVDRVPSPPR